MTPPDPASPKPAESVLDVQRQYYETRRPTQMLAQGTPYTQRHFDEVAAVARFKPGERVCEWGAGLGRHSRLLAEAGVRLDAIELSPSQVSDCRNALSQWQDTVRVLEGDAAEVMAQQQGTYDAIVGWFTLHHLTGLEGYLAAAARHLSAGGRFVFAEPNPWNPLYPLQITFTPGMRWEAEKGMYDLWPGRVREWCLRVGFVRVEITHYGFFSRAAYNALSASGLSTLPERITPARFKPFQVISAWV